MPEPPACGDQSVELDLTLTGFESASFAASNIVAFKAGLSALVRELASCITITRTVNVSTTATGRRRLLSQGQRSLLSDSQLLVLVKILTANASRTASYLAGAQQLGSVEVMLGLLGAKLDRVAYNLLSADGTPIVTSPLASPPSQDTTVPQSPAASPVQSPAQTPTNVDALAAESNSSSSMGAILGGAIGGGLGALLIIAAVVFFVRHKRRLNLGDGNTGSLRSTYANPAFVAGATATLTTDAGGAGKGNVLLTEIIESTGTPRSARRRVSTPFN